MQKFSASSSPSCANFIIGEHGRHTAAISPFFLVHVALLMLKSSDDQGSYSWRHMWESNRKSRLHVTRAWLQRLSSSPSSPGTLSITPFTFDLPEVVVMTSNLVSRSLEDQFLHWLQDMEKK